MSSDFQSHPDIAIQRLQSKGSFSDDEARDIYARAAEIQSQSEFKNTDLTPEQLERGANRAGISDAALETAIQERKAERAKAEQLAVQRAAQKALNTKRLAVGGAVAAGVLGLTLWTASSTLGARQQSVQAAQSQVENVLERRYNLVPNLIAATKSTLKNQNALIESLQSAAQAAKSASPDAQTAAESNLKQNIDRTLQALQSEKSASPVVLGLQDEMAGAENRIAVERRNLNQAIERYNRVAGGFPLGLAGRMLGYRGSYPYFQASEKAREAVRY